MRDRNRILVVGGTGQVGRHVVRGLLAGDAKVRVLTRDIEAASATFEAMGIPEDHLEDLEFTKGDLEEHGILDLLLENADRAFLLSPPSPDMEEAQDAFLGAARNAGMRLLVRLSAAGAEPTSGISLLRRHGWVDAALQAIDVPHVILRPHYFMQNLLGFASSIAAHHDFFVPMGEGRIGCVDARDIGACATRLLLDPDHLGRVFTLTGPESLNFREMAAELSETLGFSISYIDVAPEEARQAYQVAGLPDWLIDGVLELFSAYHLGAGDYTTSGVEQILGRRPRSFRSFAQDHASLLSHGAPTTH